jgi:hypothetical protein
MTTWSDSFETGFGNWSNESSVDSGDWTRNSGSTSSSGTGPSSASDGSYYLYLEASDNDYSYQANLNFDQTLSGDARISFDYHMSCTRTDDEMGALRLEAYVNSDWVCFWAKAEDQGSSWNSVSNLTIPEDATDLRFVAGCVGQAGSDIAIDNIVVEDGLTLDNSDFSNFNDPITEDFSGGTASEWTIDDSDIKITSGETPSNDTGPDGAPASDTYYCFIEGSDYQEENTATLTCDTTLNGNGGHISFYIHKYGAYMGGLILEYSTDNKSTWDVCWADGGELQSAKSDAWTEIAEFSYPENTTNLRFRFYNRATVGFERDYSLGHIIIKEAAAGGTTVTGYCTDGISLGDTPSRSAVFRAQAQDGISLSDIDVTIAQFLAQVSDGVTFSDSVTAAVKLVCQASDGIILSDSNSVQATFLAQASDGVKLSEAMSATLQAVALAQDGVQFSDTPNWGTIISALVEDGITLSDSAARTLRLLVQAADGIALSDSGAASATFSVECSDGVQLADTISAIMQLVATVSDGVAFSDTALEASTLPTGEVQISFTVKNARMIFTVKGPSAEFSNKGPTITFQ